MKKIIKSVMLSLASLFILFGCSNQTSDSTDNPSSTTIENLDPSSLSENGKYFSVEGTSDGIKITLNDNVRIKKDSGSTIQIYDMSKNKLPLAIAASVGSDIDANKKVYTYKFVENNNEYIVKLDACMLDENSNEHWEGDWAKCTAKGGLNLSDYINVDAVKSVKMKLGWNGTQFYAGIDSDKLSNKEDLIKDESIFDRPEDEYNYKFMFQLFLVLGKPNWQGAESEWWAWAGDIWINYFKTEFLIDNNNVFSRMDDLKNKFNNKYCGYINPKLKLKDGTEYEFEQIWSEQKVFDSSVTPTDSLSQDATQKDTLSSDTTPATSVRAVFVASYEYTQTEKTVLYTSTITFETDGTFSAYEITKQENAVVFEATVAKGTYSGNASVDGVIVMTMTHVLYDNETLVDVADIEDYPYKDPMQITIQDGKLTFPDSDFEYIRQ